MEHSTYRDQITGALVHQMTGHPSVNHLTYFLQRSFTPDSKTLLLTSHRTGSPEVYVAQAFLPV